MKKISTVIILALVLVIGVIGCNNDSGSEKENNINSNNENNSNNNEKEESLGVGDSSEFKRDSAATEDHVKLTVNSVEIVNEFNGFTPEEEQFLLINVTLEDLSGDNYNYDDFHVPNSITSKGLNYFYVKDEDAIVLEELDKGITSIDVIYDVPKNDTYKMSFGEGEFEFNINE